MTVLELMLLSQKIAARGCELRAWRKRFALSVAAKSSPAGPVSSAVSNHALIAADTGARE